MSIMQVTAGLKAHAAIAKAAFGGATQLALIRGADDVVLPQLTRSLDDVARSLGVLASRDAQVVIGPGVNFATDALRSVKLLGTQARSGIAPKADSFASAGQLISRIASRIDALV
jgi:hypothetical protein